MASNALNVNPYPSDEEEVFAGFSVEEIAEIQQRRQDFDREIEEMFDQSGTNSDVEIFVSGDEDDEEEDDESNESANEDAPPDLLQWSNTLSDINVEEFSVRDGPTKEFGIKVWMLADADNYYVPRFQIYLGKNRTNSELFQLKGLCYYVVWTLGEPYLDDHRHFFFDNFFTSTTLMRDLESRGMYACGTVRINRRDFPLI